MLERTRFLLRLRRGRTLEVDEQPTFVAPTSPDEPAEKVGLAEQRAPLATFRGVGRQGREPQCPTCGRFAVERRRQGDVIDLACAACGAQWSWRPGRPWPRTVPLPSLDEPTKE